MLIHLSALFGVSVPCHCLVGWFFCTEKGRGGCGVGMVLSEAVRRNAPTDLVGVVLVDPLSHMPTHTPHAFEALLGLLS